MNKLSTDKPTGIHDGYSVYQPLGQTVVLFAIMLLALVALIGIAVDVGFGFVRASQFSAAVDAAALAGVVDLDPAANDTDDADERAEQFLAANGWPVGGATTFVSGRGFTNLGIPDYSITVTWPVESFFMRIFGIEGFPVTRSATAAYFAQAEMYTVTAYERSHARKASQFIFGPQACTREGDPVSPRLAEPGQPNEGYHIANGVYRYAFRIPENYQESHVRVELFDPDSVNLQVGTIHTITHSFTRASVTGIPESSGNCLGLGDGQLCVLDTGEDRESVFHNPFWFVRVDETWDGTCAPVTSNRNGNTVTSFELYHFNGQGERVALARYVDANDPATVPYTDMRWVSPGAPGRDFIPTEFGSFEVAVDSIPEGPNNARYIFLDVKAESGNSKNVFDVHAGRPSDDPKLPNDWLIFNHINERNLTLANDPTLDPSGGIETFALGRMPIQTYYGNALMRIPLSPVTGSLVDSVIYATLFDYDHSTPPPEIIFTINTVAPSDFQAVARVSDDPSHNIAGLCNDGLNCNNAWIWPQFRLGVPSYMFRSGVLFGEYYPHRNAHTWSVSVTAGRPVLTR